jgi:hypothetical protein
MPEKGDYTCAGCDAPTDSPSCSQIKKPRLSEYLDIRPTDTKITSLFCIRNGKQRKVGALGGVLGAEEGVAVNSANRSAFPLVL